ncbi:hypothetical protein GCM10022243_38140 [Saccharothrix violaceirubra]|uniref:Tubulin-like protein n=1 Tax=Saccharothrix violaceirubra TaxID=413306 RepID=A0A7W7WWR9_9PSEU|nr:tubulin-like doman-containing protein [Saccharothrix violaceirubra]MBB4966272.1 hypothetical protein [Saccharothrix violaceirubra]
MRIYQPMMFVGLGGTGCRIGAELERRFREELCGPGGTDLVDVMPGKNFLPYQLPGCLQFVYADLSEDEFGLLERRVVPDLDHRAAAERTLHVVRDLVPQYDTYPEVARSLRLSADEEVVRWLPPQDGEPRIGPLVRGAGQLPTVGRAALFETFRSGLAPAQTPLLRALGNINNSFGELALLGGGHRTPSCDVFVAFSVAGGTGSGLFFDYLHLIGDAFGQSGLRARIYPLVVMPSAFDEGLGGGRPARLNAGRALLDLFRLVDDQNAQAAGTELDHEGVRGTLSVRYPDRAEIHLRASTVQTAFLFGRGPGVRREDLHRSVVSLILSLVGTDVATDAEDARHATQQTFMSFADSFINGAVEREAPARTGIGNRGVSTGSVASMTIPVDDIADLISSRLLAEAVSELDRVPAGAAEDNADLIDRFFIESNLDALRERAPEPISEPAPTQGATAIQRALTTRVRTMESALRAFVPELDGRVGNLTQVFDPLHALRSLLGSVDPFRAQRVVSGEDGQADEASRAGFAGALESRRGEPPAPDGIGVNPPTGLRVSGGWLRKARWADSAVRSAIARQDEWYVWRARRAWSNAWNEQAPRWQYKVEDLVRRITALTGVFRDHAAADRRRFTARTRELYQERVGVTYLLPRQGHLEPFYDAVVRRFVDLNVMRGRLRPTSTVGELVGVLLGPAGWQDAYDTVLTGRDPSVAVTRVRDRLKQEVKVLLRHRDARFPPLLPSLQDLLLAATGRSDNGIGGDELAQFREKLAGLVPGGFAPSGTGRLRILFSYPSGERDPELERYLHREVALPRGADTVVEFRPIAAETIAVVLFRTSMGLTEVPEVRDVLKYWAAALRNEESQDFLRWRQRLGYDFGYLATVPEHRERILHHLLCALWNGQVTVEGDPESPTAIVIRPGARERPSMRLQPLQYGRLSSWAGVLAAYEEWVLTDDEQIRLDLCAALIATTPRGVDHRPDPPASVFDLVWGLAATELRLIDEAIAEGGGDLTRLHDLREFWAETLPAALKLPFRGVNRPLRDNLADLRGWFEHDAGQEKSR